MPEQIRVQAADGQWETLGFHRHPGVFPEGIVPSWNEEGPEGLTFALKRSPELAHPDLEEFTPVEYLPDGGDRHTWTGFIIDTPAAGEDGISVSCLGWQHHGDDDPFSKLYALNRVTDFADARSSLLADLSQYTSGGLVNAGEEGLALSYPGPHPAVVGFRKVGAVLDLGAGLRVKRLAIDWERIGAWAGTATAYLYVADDLGAALAAVGATVITTLGGVAAGSSTFATDTPTGGRFLVIFCDSNQAQDPTTAFRVAGIRIYGDTAYADANGVSALTADKILKDLPARAPLLSPDTSLIATTTLALEDLAARNETVRTVAKRVNDYHGYRLKVDHCRRIVFQPQSDRAVLAVDLAKPGARFRDASANSGRPVYNKVIVRGVSGAGEPLEVIRYSAQVFPPRILPTSSPAPTNPSADVDTAGWSAAAGSSLARDTVTFDSAPAAIRWDTVDVADTITATFTGTFKLGNVYRLRFPFRFGGNPSIGRIRFELGAGGDFTWRELGWNDAVRIFPPRVARWVTIELFWVPSADRTGVTLKATCIGALATLPPMHFDTLSLGRSIATAPDRRGFMRAYTLEVNGRSDTEAMTALGDAFLRSHAYSPLAGELEVTSDKAVTLLANDQPVGLGELGVYTGELILLRNLVDPDTGDLGRVAVLKTASRSGESAKLAVDNERANFQTLLNRMGARSQR